MMISSAKTCTAGWHRRQYVILCCRTCFGLVPRCGIEILFEARHWHVNYFFRKTINRISGDFKMPKKTKLKKSDATRERILKAAIKEFSRNGFNGARVDLIAEKARINKERLYAYFGGKPGLYKASMRKVFSGIGEAEKKLMTFPLDKPECLNELLIKIYSDFLDDHPEFWRFLIFENLEGGRHVEALPHMPRPAFAHLRSVYRRGQDTGVFQRDIGFKYYLFTITALVFFAYSNRITVSRTLGLDLKAPSAASNFLKECLKLLRISAE